MYTIYNVRSFNYLTLTTLSKFIQVLMLTAWRCRKTRLLYISSAPRQCQPPGDCRHLILNPIAPKYGGNMAGCILV